MSWHHRLYHLPFNQLFMLAKAGFLPKKLLECQDKVPLCVACQFGKAHRRPWRTKGKKSGSIRKPEEKEPGDGVSIDQIVSAQPGLIPQMSGFLTNKRIWGTTTFVDHVSNYVYVHLMRDFTLEETLLAKAAWEKILARANRKVKHYHADNGRFADNGFLQSVNSKDQEITFCGVGAHHQNGIVEGKNRVLTQGARTLLLHAMRMWPQMIDSMFWPFAFKAVAERLNNLQIGLDGSTPYSLMHGLDVSEVPVKTYHTLFCPVYVLDSRLQSAGGPGPPKWEPRSRIGVYLGHSPFHAGSVALVFNPSTGRVSPQYHVVFDDEFSTVPYMEAGTVPPNWADLHEHSRGLSTNQDYKLAETWLDQQGNPEDPAVPRVDAVADPYAVVDRRDVTTTDSRGRKLDQLNPPPDGPATMAGPQTPGAGASEQLGRRIDLPVNEGGHLDSVSKRRRIEASDSSANTVPERKGVQTNRSGLASTERTGSKQELRMPTRVNLHELGLRRSPSLKALREKEEASKANSSTKAHVSYGTRAKKAAVTLFTLLSFTAKMDLPRHQSPPK